MKRSYSAGASRSRPSPACSARECSVSTPTFSPRSGCARISASCSSSDARVHRAPQRRRRARRRRRSRPAARRARPPTASARTARRSAPRTCRGRRRSGRSAPAARAANASTSTSPRSVIFSDGITDSARNDSVMNGAPISTPCSRSRSWRCSSPSATSSSGASESSPAIGSGSSPTHLAVARDDQPAAELLRARRAQRHVAVGDADHDEVVRVVGDGRRERARVQPEPAHEPEPDAARPVVALDHGDLGQVALGSATTWPSSIGGSEPAPVISWPGSMSITRTRVGRARDVERDRHRAHRVAQRGRHAPRGTTARARP